MVRRQASVADTALIAAASERGAAPTATQLERWRAAGLLPRNEQRGAGRGRGSVSTTPPESIDLVMWLSAHARPGRRPGDLALEAFGAGLPVPEPTVRRAFRAAATGSRLDALLEPGDVTDRSEWIAGVAQELAAEHSGRSVLLPQRIRDIDARIAAAAIPFAMPEVAPFDKGTYDTEPYTSRNFLTTAVSAVLGGTSELSEGDLAAVARAMAPPGAAVPVASMLEYPDDDPQLAHINDGHGLTLLPTGDARVDLDRIVTEASLTQLRAAWQAVDDMRRWAVSLCDTVEAELDGLAAGKPLSECAALQQWFLGIILGLNRVLLRQALLEPAPPASARASTAVMLLSLATGICRLRVMVPDGRFELLPVLLPPFLYELTELVAADLPASLRANPA
ncbi:hypothetical protein [Polymorphospora lycopeni]|uniref:HTH merR-type domain-containing protein n=1 Tax=Polymorphospora lycopeni TaxID=3140240 RepID=A0ABV5CK64_9ACTN